MQTTARIRVAGWIFTGLALAGSGFEAAELQLANDVVPTFQEIRLKLDADRADYSGSVRVELNVLQPTNTFQFHSEGQVLGRVALHSAAGEIGLKHEAGDDGVITVVTGVPLEKGPHTLEIEFTHDFNTRAVGLYRMVQGDDGYLFTQFEAVDARKAFPCWDEPRFKISWRMTLEVPEAHTAVFNTPVERESAAKGWKTIVFRKTRPMPSYLLAIASGRLESVPIPGMSIPGRLYTVTGQSHLGGLTVEMTPKILKALERYFGQGYPYEKLDVLAVPEYWFGGMENPGLIVCTDSAVLLDPKAAGIAQKSELAGLMAHEIAHMWFGDMVTMTWWDDLWLNESFATYVGQKITHELYPEFEVDLARRRSVQGLMSSDARPSTTPVRRPIETNASIFEDLGLAYGKGSTVLGMIEQWIGPEDFRKGVLNYLEAHAWGNSVASDLWNSLSEASGIDVSGPLSGFLDQAGLPLIDVTVAGGSVTLKQRRFLNAGVLAPKQTWSVPVQLRYFDGDSLQTKDVLLDSESKQIQLGGEVDWIFPDDGAHGYYRWNLPQEMLLSIAAHATDRLDAPERIVFLGNAAALLDAGLLSGGQYLEMLNQFADDPEPEVVSSVVSGVGKVEGAFVPDELRDAFAGYVRATLGPMLDRFGMQSAEGEDETVALLRPRLIGWLGENGRDPAVRRYAAELAGAYMTDPQSVDPALAGTALDIAAIDGNREMFDKIKQHFETAETPVERGLYLSALGSFDNPQLRREALNYALSDAMRPDEVLSIPFGMVETDADADQVFGWLTEHYGEVTSRIPEMMAAFMPFAASGCSTERLEAAGRFFAKPEHVVDGTANNLRKVADSVADCVNLRKREGQAVAGYLAQFRKGG